MSVFIREGRVAFPSAYEQVFLEHDRSRKPTSIFPFSTFFRTLKDQGIVLPVSNLLCIPPIGTNVESYLLTQMIRRSANDCTGIVPHLLGVAKNQEDVLQIMTSAAKGALDMPRKSKVLNTLFKDGPCTIETLLDIDRMWAYVVRVVRETAYNRRLAVDKTKMSPQAQKFKNASLDSLDLRRRFHSLEQIVDRRYMLDERGNLVDVTEQLKLPDIPIDKVKELSKILPDVFRKTDTSSANLTLEERVLRELGKVGNDFTRTLIAMMRNEETSEKLLERI